MGHPVIYLDSFGNESKGDLVPYASVNSIDDVTPTAAQDSTIHLFHDRPSLDEQKWNPTVRDRLVFICIVILAMMDTFDATVLLPILPYLAFSFNMPLVSTFWVNTAYLIVSAASQPFFTMICDVFSHGPVWIIAVLCTTIGTGICSGSMSLTELIIGRLVQGIGGGGTMSLCLVAMAESAPESIHSRYSCYIQLTRMFGFILGPIIGGLFADNARWTWAFYFNFIFCVLGLLLLPFAVDLRAAKNVALHKLRTLDWPGAVMAFLGPGSVLVGLAWGGISYGWDEWQTLVPIAVGLSVMAALGFYEAKWALHPYFGGPVFRTRSLAMTYLGIFCHGFVVFGQLQFFALYFVSDKSFSATLSSVALLAITGLAVTPAAVVGILLARESQYSKWIIPGGWILTTLSAGCSILLDTDTPTVGWVFLFFTAGLGHGLLLSSYNIRIHGVAQEGDDDLSTKPVHMSLFMRAWGMAVTVPVGGVVFLNMFDQELRNIGLHADLVAAPDYLVLTDQVEMSNSQREAINDVCVLALRVVWEVIAGVSAVGGISSIFLWRKC